jgi:hypothetical protein
MKKIAVRIWVIFALMIAGGEINSPAQVTFPDLAVADVKLKDCYVIVTIVNLGGQGFPSHRQGHVSVQFLQNGQGAGGWNYNVLYAPRLRKKGGKLTFTVNQKMIEGTMEVRIRIDPENRIQELKENNNNASRSFTCTVQKYIEVLTPNGGERWARGRQYALRWKKSGIHWSARVDLFLRKEGDFGSEKIPVTQTGIGASPVSIYNWTIPMDFLGGNYWLYVATTDGSAQDRSDSLFSIEGPFIQVLSPNGGEQWTSAGPKLIRWTSHSVTGQVKILLHTQRKRMPPVVITPGTANSGRFTFTPSRLPSGPCFIEVSTVDGRITDYSDQAFTIRIK